MKKAILILSVVGLMASCSSSTENEAPVVDSTAVVTVDTTVVVAIDSGFEPATTNTVCCEKK